MEEDDAILVSSESDEDESRIWVKKCKNKQFKQLWQKVQPILFHHFLPKYKSSYFPYGKFKELAEDLRKSLTEVYVESTQAFIWKNLIRWLVSMKLCYEGISDLKYDERYNLILTDFMAQYMNYKCNLYSTITDETEVCRRVDEILVTLGVVFSGNIPSILMTLLKIDVKDVYRLILDPIFRKYLMNKNIYESDDLISYLRLILCYRQWKKLVHFKEQKELINEIAVGKSRRALKYGPMIDLTTKEAVLPKTVPTGNETNQSFLVISDLIRFAIRNKAYGTRILLINRSLDLEETIVKYFQQYEKYINRSDLVLCESTKALRIFDEFWDSSGCSNPLPQPMLIENVKKSPSRSQSLTEGTALKSAFAKRSILEEEQNKFQNENNIDRQGTNAVNQHLSMDCDISRISYSLNRSNLSSNSKQLSPSSKKKSQSSNSNVKLNVLHNKKGFVIELDTTDDEDDDNIDDESDGDNDKDNNDDDNHLRNAISNKKQTEKTPNLGGVQGSLIEILQQRAAVSGSSNNYLSRRNSTIVLSSSSDEDESVQETNSNANATQRVLSQLRMGSETNRNTNQISRLQERPSRKEKLRCITGEVSSTTLLDCSSTPDVESSAAHNVGTLANAREVGTLSAVRISPRCESTLASTDDSDVSDEEPGPSSLAGGRNLPRFCWSKVGVSKVVEEATSSTSEIPARTGSEALSENVVFSIRTRRSTSSSPCPTRTTSPTVSCTNISPSSTIRIGSAMSDTRTRSRVTSVSRITVRRLNSLTGVLDEEPTCSRSVKRPALTVSFDDDSRERGEETEDYEVPTCSRYVAGGAPRVSSKGSAREISDSQQSSSSVASVSPDCENEIEVASCSRYTTKVASTLNIEKDSTGSQEKVVPLVKQSDTTHNTNRVVSLKSTPSARRCSIEMYPVPENLQLTPIIEKENSDLKKFLNDISVHIGDSQEENLVGKSTSYNCKEKTTTSLTPVNKESASQNDTNIEKTLLNEPMVKEVITLNKQRESASKIFKSNKCVSELQEPQSQILISKHAQESKSQLQERGLEDVDISDKQCEEVCPKEVQETNIRDQKSEKSKGESGSSKDHISTFESSNESEILNEVAKTLKEDISNVNESVLTKTIGRLTPFEDSVDTLEDIQSPLLDEESCYDDEIESPAYEPICSKTPEKSKALRVSPLKGFVPEVVDIKTANSMICDDESVDIEAVEGTMIGDSICKGKLFEDNTIINSATENIVAKDRTAGEVIKDRSIEDIDSAFDKPEVLNDQQIQQDQKTDNQTKAAQTDSKVHPECNDQITEVLCVDKTSESRNEKDSLASKDCISENKMSEDTSDDRNAHIQVHIDKSTDGRPFIEKPNIVEGQIHIENKPQDSQRQSIVEELHDKNLPCMEDKSHVKNQIPIEGPTAPEYVTENLLSAKDQLRVANQCHAEDKLPEKAEDEISSENQDANYRFTKNNVLKDDVAADQGAISHILPENSNQKHSNGNPVCEKDATTTKAILQVSPSSDNNESQMKVSALGKVDDFNKSIAAHEDNKQNEEKKVIEKRLETIGAEKEISSINSVSRVEKSGLVMNRKLKMRIASLSAEPQKKLSSKQVPEIKHNLQEKQIQPVCTVEIKFSQETQKENTIKSDEKPPEKMQSAEKQADIVNEGSLATLVRQGEETSLQESCNVTKVSLIQSPKKPTSMETCNEIIVSSITQKPEQELQIEEKSAELESICKKIENTPNTFTPAKVNVTMVGSADLCNEYVGGVIEKTTLSKSPIDELTESTVTENKSVTTDLIKKIVFEKSETIDSIKSPDKGEADSIKITCNKNQLIHRISAEKQPGVENAAEQIMPHYKFKTAIRNSVVKSNEQSVSDCAHKKINQLPNGLDCPVKTIMSDNPTSNVRIPHDFPVDKPTSSYELNNRSFETLSAFKSYAKTSLFSSRSSEPEQSLLFNLRRTEVSLNEEDSNLSTQVQVAAEDLGDPAMSFDSEIGDHSPAYLYNCIDTIQRDSPVVYATAQINHYPIEDQEVSTITSQECQIHPYNTYHDDCDTPVLDEKDGDDVESPTSQRKIVSLSILKEIPTEPLIVPAFINHISTYQHAPTTLPKSVGDLAMTSENNFSSLQLTHTPQNKMDLELKTISNISSLVCPAETNDIPTTPTTPNSGFIEPTAKTKPTIEKDSEEYRGTPLKKRFKRLSQCADINKEFNLDPCEPIKPKEIAKDQVWANYTDSVTESADSMQLNMPSLSDNVPLNLVVRPDKNSTKSDISEQIPQMAKFEKAPLSLQEDDQSQKTWFKKRDISKTNKKILAKDLHSPTRIFQPEGFSSGFKEVSVTRQEVPIIKPPEVINSPENSPVVGKNEGRRRKPSRVKKLTEQSEMLTDDSSVPYIDKSLVSSHSNTYQQPIAAHQDPTTQSTIKTDTPVKEGNLVGITYDTEEIKAAAAALINLRHPKKVDESLKIESEKPTKPSKSSKQKASKRASPQTIRFLRSTSQRLEKSPITPPAASNKSAAKKESKEMKSLPNKNTSNNYSSSESIWQQEKTKEILRSSNTSSETNESGSLNMNSSRNSSTYSYGSSDSDDTGKLVIDHDANTVSDLNQKNKTKPAKNNKRKNAGKKIDLEKTVTELTQRANEKAKKNKEMSPPVVTYDESIHSSPNPVFKLTPDVDPHFTCGRRPEPSKSTDSYEVRDLKLADENVAHFYPINEFTENVAFTPKTRRKRGRKQTSVKSTGRSVGRRIIDMNKVEKSEHALATLNAETKPSPKSRTTSKSEQLGKFKAKLDLETKFYPISNLVTELKLNEGAIPTISCAIGSVDKSLNKLQQLCNVETKTTNESGLNPKANIKAKPKLQLASGNPAILANTVQIEEKFPSPQIARNKEKWMANLSLTKTKSLDEVVKKLSEGKPKVNKPKSPTKEIVPLTAPSTAMVTCKSSELTSPTENGNPKKLKNRRKSLVTSKTKSLSTASSSESINSNISNNEISKIREQFGQSQPIRNRRKSSRIESTEPINKSGEKTSTISKPESKDTTLSAETIKIPEVFKQQLQETPETELALQLIMLKHKGSKGKALKCTEVKQIVKNVNKLEETVKQLKRKLESKASSKIAAPKNENFIYNVNNCSAETLETSKDAEQQLGDASGSKTTKTFAETEHRETVWESSKRIDILQSTETVQFVEGTKGHLKQTSESVKEMLDSVEPVITPKETQQELKETSKSTPMLKLTVCRSKKSASKCTEVFHSTDIVKDLEDNEQSVKETSESKLMVKLETPKPKKIAPYAAHTMERVNSAEKIKQEPKETSASKSTAQLEMPKGKKLVSKDVKCTKGTQQKLKGKKPKQKKSLNFKEVSQSAPTAGGNQQAHKELPDAKTTSKLAKPRKSVEEIRKYLRESSKPKAVVQVKKSAAGTLETTGHIHSADVDKTLEDIQKELKPTLERTENARTELPIIKHIPPEVKKLDTITKEEKTDAIHSAERLTEKEKETIKINSDLEVGLKFNEMGQNKKRKKSIAAANNKEQIEITPLENTKEAIQFVKEDLTEQNLGPKCIAMQIQQLSIDENNLKITFEKSSEIIEKSNKHFRKHSKRTKKAQRSLSVEKSTETNDLIRMAETKEEKTTGAVEDRDYDAESVEVIEKSTETNGINGLADPREDKITAGVEDTNCMVDSVELIEKPTKTNTITGLAESMEDKITAAVEDKNCQADNVELEKPTKTNSISGLTEPMEDKITAAVEDRVCQADSVKLIEKSTKTNSITGLTEPMEDKMTAAVEDKDCQVDNVELIEKPTKTNSITGLTKPMEDKITAAVEDRVCQADNVELIEKPTKTYSITGLTKPMEDKITAAVEDRDCQADNVELIEKPTKGYSTTGLTESMEDKITAAVEDRDFQADNVELIDKPTKTNSITGLTDSREEKINAAVEDKDYEAESVEVIEKSTETTRIIGLADLREDKMSAAVEDRVCQVDSVELIEKPTKTDSKTGLTEPREDKITAVEDRVCQADSVDLNELPKNIQSAGITMECDQHSKENLDKSNSVEEVNTMEAIIECAEPAYIVKPVNDLKDVANEIIVNTSSKEPINTGSTSVMEPKTVENEAELEIIGDTVFAKSFQESRSKESLDLELKEGTSISSTIDHLKTIDKVKTILLNSTEPAAVQCVDLASKVETNLLESTEPAAVQNVDLANKVEGNLLESTEPAAVQNVDLANKVEGNLIEFTESKAVQSIKTNLKPATVQSAEKNATKSESKITESPVSKSLQDVKGIIIQKETSKEQHISIDSRLCGSSEQTQQPTVPALEPVNEETKKLVIPGTDFEHETHKVDFNDTQSETLISESILSTDINLLEEKEVEIKVSEAIKSGMKFCKKNFRKHCNSGNRPGPKSQKKCTLTATKKRPVVLLKKTKFKLISKQLEKDLKPSEDLTTPFVVQETKKEKETLSVNTRSIKKCPERKRISLDCDRSLTNSPISLRTRSRSMETSKKVSIEAASFKNIKLRIDENRIKSGENEKTSTKVECSVKIVVKPKDEVQRVAEQLELSIKNILGNQLSETDVNNSSGNMSNIMLTNQPQGYDSVPDQIFAGNGDANDIEALTILRPNDLMLESISTENSRQTIEEKNHKLECDDDDDETKEPPLKKSDSEKENHDDENESAASSTLANTSGTVTSSELDLDLFAMTNMTDIGSSPVFEANCISEYQISGDRLNDVLNHRIVGVTPVQHTDCMISGMDDYKFDSKVPLNLPPLHLELEIESMTTVSPFEVSRKSPKRNADSGSFITSKPDVSTDVEPFFENYFEYESLCAILAPDDSLEKRSKESKLHQKDDAVFKKPNCVQMPTEDLTTSKVPAQSAINYNAPAVEVSTEVGFESYDELYADNKHYFPSTDLEKSKQSKPRCSEKETDEEVATTPPVIENASESVVIMESEMNVSESQKNKLSSAGATVSGMQDKQKPNVTKPENKQNEFGSSKKRDKDTTKSSAKDGNELTDKPKSTTARLALTSSPSKQEKISSSSKIKSHPSTPFWYNKSKSPNLRSTSDQKLSKLNLDVWKNKDVHETIQNTIPMGSNLNTTSKTSDDKLISNTKAIEREPASTKKNNVTLVDISFPGNLDSLVEVQQRVSLEKLPDLDEIPVSKQLEPPNKKSHMGTFTRVSTEEPPNKKPRVEVTTRLSAQEPANKKFRVEDVTRLSTEEPPNKKPRVEDVITLSTEDASNKQHHVEAVTNFSTKETPNKKPQVEAITSISKDDLFDRLKRESPVNPLMKKLKPTLKKASSFETDDNSSRDSTSGLLSLPISCSPAVTDLVSSSSTPCKSPQITSTSTIIVPSMPLISTPSRLENSPKISELIEPIDEPTYKAPTPLIKNTDMFPKRNSSSSPVQMFVKLDVNDKPAPSNLGVKCSRLKNDKKKLQEIIVKSSSPNVQEKSSALPPSVPKVNNSPLANKLPSNSTKVERDTKPLTPQSEPVAFSKPIYSPKPNVKARVTFSQLVTNIPDLNPLKIKPVCSSKSASQTYKSILISPSKVSALTSDSCALKSLLSRSSSPVQSPKLVKPPLTSPAATLSRKNASTIKPPSTSKRPSLTPTMPTSSRSSSAIDLGSLTAEIELLSANLTELPEKAPSYLVHRERKRLLKLHEQKLQQLKELEKQHYADAKQLHRASKSKSQSERQPSANPSNHESLIPSSQRELKGKYIEQRRYVNKFQELKNERFNIPDRNEQRPSTSQEAKTLPPWDPKPATNEEILADLKLKKLRRN